MKFKLTLALITLINISGYNQEFAPIGSIWHFPIHYFTTSSIDVLTIESVGDSLIQDKTCKVLYRDESTSYGGLGEYYLYQNQDSVFQYIESTDQFDLIFVFNLMEGDTFVIQKSYSDQLIAPINCIVDSISFIEIMSGAPLRVQHVRIEYRSTLGTDTIDLTTNKTLIERIGFEDGIFPNGLEISAGDWRWEGPIRCYEDNQLGLINFSNVDCLFTPVNEKYNYEKRVYPNPATNELNILFSDEIASLEIISLSGEYVVVLSNPTSPIDISNISSGVYALRIKTKDNHVILNKLAVEKK